MKTKIIFAVLFALTIVAQAQNFNTTGTATAVYRDGKTGFGMTTTPASGNPIEVETTAAETGIIITQKAAGGAALYLNNIFNGGRKWALYSLNNSNTPAGGHFLIQDATSAANRFMISGTNGNIGVGTVSPLNKIHISTAIADDGLLITQTGSGSAGLILNNTTAGGKQWSLNSLGNGSNHGAGNFSIYDNSNSLSRFFINGSNGNIGMGTTTPANKIHVSTSTIDDGIKITQTGSGGAALHLYNSTTGGHNYGVFSYGSGSSYTGDFGIYDYTASAFRFHIDGTTGNVGIGTNAPGQKLDVAGNINTNGTVTIGSNFILGSSGSFKNNAWAGTGNRLIVTDATGNLSALTQGSATQVLYGNGTWGNLATSSFTESGSNVSLPSGKNLGIGTTPSAPLDVVGDANVRGNVRSTNLAGTGERIVVADANGNLKAIGGGSNGGACVNAMPWCLGGNYPAGTTLPHNNIGTCNNVPFILKSNDVQSVFIQPNSFVGIGLNNANPTAALDVSDGSVSNSYHMRIFGNANGDIISNTHMKLAVGTGKIFEITEGGGPNRMLISASGNAAFGDNSTAALNNAKLNVNSASANALAFAIADNSGSPSKDFFTVQGNGYTEIKVYSPLTMPKPYSSTNERVFTVRDMANNKDLFALTAQGKVYAREVEINLTATFPDYVFASDYKLKTINEVADFIKENKHLPGFEKGEYYEKNGINVNDMFVKQQEKMEEMMLYIIELEKRLKTVEANK